MVSLFGMQLTRHDIESHTGRLDQIGGITPFELVDGRARGVRGARIATGTGFSFTAMADRALDLFHAEYRGIPLCWRSANGDVAPAFYEAANAEWLRTFAGGLLTTCGLTNIGPGGTDRYGTVGQHGRISCLPAEGVRYLEEWDGDECRLEVSGTIRESRVFAENLVLRRRLQTWLGSCTLRLEDTVTNEGSEPFPHMILYHWNPGFPLLSPASQLHVSHSGMRPRDHDAEAGMEVWNKGAAPRAGFKEQVFVHTPQPCADGRAAAVLVQPELQAGEGLALAVRFDPRQLPALIQWRMLGEGTYVLGIEPANCPTIEGRIEAEKQGTLPFLQPGESRRYDLEVQVLTTRDEIERMVHLIEEANHAAGTSP